MGISYLSVELGRATLTHELEDGEKSLLAKRLIARGFELLESEKSGLLSNIKTVIIEQIHHATEPLTVNFSTFLSEKLNHEYTSMSRLFSAAEGITIEKFITQQKIEKVKELLIYNELTLSEIAFQLDYSSVAYLSSQFKKETGMTPSDFKKQLEPSRKSLDSI